MPFYYPGAYHHGHSHFHFGCRRIFWFAVGAATAVWWNRHRDGHLCGGRRQQERLEQGHTDQGSGHDDVPPDSFRAVWNGKGTAPQNSSRQPSTTEWWDKEKVRLADVGRQANEAVSPFVYRRMWCRC